MEMVHICLLVLTLCCSCSRGIEVVEVDPKRMTIAAGENASFTIQLKTASPNLVVIHLYEGSTAASVQHEVTFPANTMGPRRVHVQGVKPGFCNITMNSTGYWWWDVVDASIEVRVVRSHALSIVAILFGWVYAVLWSIPFYRQVILSFRRKSDEGSSSDILAYNATGFLAYAFFNCFMYLNEPIKTSYKVLYPHGVHPVLLNDVVFSLHGIFITVVLAVQYIKYETGQRMVSDLCRAVHSVAFFVAFLILLFAAFPGRGTISWLVYLYFLSFIKLGFTSIIYLTEIWSKCVGESLDSWCITNFLLEFAGGAFSVLQVVLLYFNNDDWTVLGGNPAKCSLGSTAMSFSIIFIVLHYVFSRRKNLSIPDRLTLVDEENLDGDRSTEISDPVSPSLRESREPPLRVDQECSDDPENSSLREGFVSKNANLA